MPPEKESLHKFLKPYLSRNIRLPAALHLSRPPFYNTKRFCRPLNQATPTNEHLKVKGSIFLKQNDKFNQFGKLSTLIASIRRAKKSLRARLHETRSELKPV